LEWAWPDAVPPEVWRSATGTGYSGAVIADGRVLVHSRRGDEECVECLDADEGQLLWSVRTPTAYRCKYPYSEGPYATPAIADGVVYTVGAEAFLQALDLETGERRWSRQLQEEGLAAEGAYGFGVSPRIVQGLVILNVGGGPGRGIVAFDAQTGETRWTATDHGRSYATAVPVTNSDGSLVLVLTEAALVALRPESGDVLWEFPFGLVGIPENVNAVSPLVIGDRVALSSCPGPGVTLLQFDATAVNTVWQGRRGICSQYANLVAVGSRLYGVTARRSAVLRAADLATGEPVWTFESDLGRCQSLVADDHLVCWGEHGHLANFDLRGDEPALVAMTPEPLLQTPCYSPPALADGRLFVRNEQWLLCLELRRPPAGP
jgi:hypothetical protein